MSSRINFGFGSTGGKYVVLGDAENGSVTIVVGSSSIRWACATVLMIGLGLILVVDLRLLLLAWRCPIGVASETGSICVVFCYKGRECGEEPC